MTGWTSVGTSGAGATGGTGARLDSFARPARLASLARPARQDSKKGMS